MAFAGADVSAMTGLYLKLRLEPPQDHQHCDLGHSLALYFLAFGALLLVAVLLDDLAARVRVPGILMVLILGLLVDNHLNVASDAADAIPPLLSHVHADQITQAALVLVLFFGGLTTNWAEMRSVIPSALRLATFGALFTALLLTLAMLGFGEADGSAVGEGVAPAALVTEVLRQFLLGILLGFLGGSLTTQVLGSRRSLNTNSMLPVVSLALLMVLAGGTTLMGGSALLAAYVAGLVLGNGSSTDQLVLEQAHASFAKMAQLLLFLCMGLVVSPEDVVRAAGGAFLLFLLMQVVRWLIVHFLLLRSSFSLGQRKFVGCAGLRVAVPIALAIQVWASSSVSWGKTMPPLALAVVLFGLLFQGFALVPIANRLGLASPVEAPLSAL